MSVDFPESERAARFRRRYFPDATAAQWADWRWQLRNRVRDQAGVERIFSLTETEREGFARGGRSLPVGMPPYYVSVVADGDPGGALRKTMIPRAAEFEVHPGERADPLGEDDHRPVPGIVHTYPDKVLFLVTDFCATYCRYCTRGRMVGAGEYVPDRQVWDEAIAYIEGDTRIRDVLFSGGDPFILSDERLGGLLDRVRAIPHVEILRIGTKIPAVLPQRITHGLVERLRRVHPLWLSIHVTHPAECTDEVGEACARLADGGIPLMAQTVLLKDVNNDAEVLRRLFTTLLRFRVKPYYLHQCDPILGSGHFKTAVEEGKALIRSLHGHTTGYAVPHFMIDAPGGGGKVAIGPDSVAGREDGDLLLRGYQGSIYRYPDRTE